MTVNANGTPGHVASGELVESAWGNATADAITRLWAYQAPRIVFSGAVVTNANGDFAVSTGFVATAVTCLSMQTAFPAIFVVRDFPFEAAQVVLRALNPTNLNPYASATISVTYVIYGPLGNV